MIEALAGVKIKKVVAGGWHSCAISTTGDVYSWGWNSNGQLGVTSKQNVSVFATPQPIYLADPDCSVDDIACGSKHTVIRLGNFNFNLQWYYKEFYDNFIGTQIYGAGWNKYKQLGNVEEENVYEFKLLKDFYPELTKSIICGPWCTAVLTS